MSIVFIVGAGASHGEELIPLEGAPKPMNIAGCTTPMTNGFFSGDLLNRLGYEPAETAEDFNEAFSYIRRLKHIPRESLPGDSSWDSIDLEEVFTSIELSRLFQGTESDEAARCVLIRNSLIRYVWRIISTCTLGLSGSFSRKLIHSLPWNHSLITFNYDLLFDQELIQFPAPIPHFARQYEHFRALVLEGASVDDDPDGGLFLKMHGSLNWCRCTNASCPAASIVSIDTNTQDCLHRALGIHFGEKSCAHRGSAAEPFIVPPLFRKPVAEDGFMRTVWGLARKKLEEAEGVVLVGFSAAPTDFYASWLIRTTVGVRSETDVIVVNPANDPEHHGHSEHFQRMKSIFPGQMGTEKFNGQFRTFAEIQGVLDLLGEKGYIHTT